MKGGLRVHRAERTRMGIGKFMRDLLSNIRPHMLPILLPCAVGWPRAVTVICSITVDNEFTRQILLDCLSTHHLQNCVTTHLDPFRPPVSWLSTCWRVLAIQKGLFVSRCGKAIPDLTDGLGGSESCPITECIPPTKRALLRAL
jgi:hypothetical protein